MNFRGKKAFTLIELLVVIAIIVLLLAVLMPALTKAKDLAKMVVCMTNHKTLVTAWKTYSTDNNGQIVGGNVNGRNNGAMVPGNTEDWALAPVINTPSGLQWQFNVNGVTPRENELEGIRNGQLFSYVQDVDSYRCPADRRYSKRGVEGWPASFRSYSITCSMNGERGPWNPKNYFQKEIGATKESHISQPDSRFVFIDDFDPRGFNIGSWCFTYYVDNSQPHTIADPISVWHFKKCNFSYADGHAESYVWKNQNTHKYCRERAFGWPVTVSPIPDSSNNDDVHFLAEGYRAH